MGRIGNYTVDYVLGYLRSIPLVDLQDKGAVYIAQYRGVFNGGKLSDLRVHAGMNPNDVTSWLKKVYAAEKRLPELPPKQTIDELLKKGVWN